MAIVRVRCRKEPGMFRAAIYWPSTVTVREVDEDVLAKIKTEALLDVIELDDWPEDHRPTPEAAPEQPPEQPPATLTGDAPPVENEPEREVGATSNAAPVSEPEPEPQPNEQPETAPRRRR